MQSQDKGIPSVVPEDGGNQSGAALNTCHFYKELGTLLGGDTMPVPKEPVDSFHGTESETGLHLEAEVLDEEMEVVKEEGVHCGPTCAPGSEEFVVLMP